MFRRISQKVFPYAKIFRSKSPPSDPLQALYEQDVKSMKALLKTIDHIENRKTDKELLDMVAHQLVRRMYSLD